MNREKSEEISR